MMLFYGCANPVTPTGGPKDVTPPKVISCTPPNLSTNFKATSIRISFSEFVGLKNPASEIFISPPLPKAPDTRIRGKDILIKLQDTLRPNTTYSISFGQAIADITENNLLKGFTYVFSTGPYVDSLSIKGKVISAADHQPQKNVFVTLYINNNDTLPLDSLPLKLPPYYLTKTGDQGEFTLTNLQQADFKMMALADQNGDLIFNQPSEKIAFLDSLVKPYYIEIPKPVAPDTLKKDSVPAKPVKKPILTPEQIRKADSVREADSVKALNAKYPSYVLSMFEEIDSTQRISKSNVPREGMIVFIFKYPFRDATFSPLNLGHDTSWCIRENTPNRDSVILWLTGPHPDTIIIKVADNGKIIDTVRLDVRKKEVKKKKEEKDAPPERLTFTTNGGGGGFNQYRSQFTLTFSYPLRRWDFSRLQMIDGKDTLKPRCLFADSIRRRVGIIHKWKEDKPYKLLIPDSVFYGINGLTTDSLKYEFKSRAQKDFGNLVLTFNPTRPGQYIIQVLNDKESVVVEEQIATTPGKLKFNNMTTGKFKIKAILDKNRNKRWDTGNYKKNLQPEEVFYLPKIIEIRANWDIEETWDF